MHRTPGAAHRKQVATRASAEDPVLRGRAYCVRFGTVWAAALRAAGSLRGWSVVDTDSRAGEIHARAEGWAWKRPDRATIMVTLDDRGLTRVDLVVTPLGWRLGRGPSVRRVRRFYRSIDRALAAGR